MDVAEAGSAHTTVKDDVGERCQKLFQDFLEEWVAGNDPKHVHASAALHNNGLHQEGTLSGNVDSWRRRLGQDVYVVGMWSL